MTTKELAEKYNVNQSTFEQFLSESNLLTMEGLHIVVPDDKIDNYLVGFRYWLKKQNENEANRTAREREKQIALSSMLISSGFNFDGYTIVKYSGYISGDDAVEIPRGGIFGNNNGRNLTDALVKIRRQALIELKEAAYNLGCNAVVGVDFDYLTLEPERSGFNRTTVYEPYVICVTANGNAVVIEKNET